MLMNAPYPFIDVITTLSALIFQAGIHAIVCLGTPHYWLITVEDYYVKVCCLFLFLKLKHWLDRFFVDINHSNKNIIKSSQIKNKSYGICKNCSYLLFYNEENQFICFITKSSYNVNNSNKNCIKSYFN